MQIVVFNDLIFHTGCFLGILSSKSKIRYFVRICFLCVFFLLLALSVCRLGWCFFFRLILLLIIRVIWIGYCYAAQQCIGFGRQQLKCADNHGKRLVSCIFRWFFVFLLFYSHKMKNPLNQYLELRWCTRTMDAVVVSRGLYVLHWIIGCSRSSVKRKLVSQEKHRCTAAMTAATMAATFQFFLYRSFLPFVAGVFVNVTRASSI